MKPRHLIALAGLVTLPLGAALVLGVASLRESEGERRLAQSARLGAGLEELRGQYRQLRQDWEQRLQALAAACDGGDAALQRLSSDDPLVRQAFRLDASGRLAYPRTAGASQAEQEFLARAATFLGDAWYPPRPERGDWPASGGWYRWFWQDGLQLLWWQPRDGGFLCFDLNRSALLGELSGRLYPLGLTPEQLPSNLVRLDDEQGKAFLQWGHWPAGLGYHAELPLNGPFEGWSLSWDLDPDQVDNDRSAGLALAFSLAALILAAGGLAVYFLRGYRRELREAGLRVSFVNQVSHELKSPLTNIRLYAELLETKLAPDQIQAREYAAIIQREGRRLGRLIHNVLSFGRQEKNGPADSPRVQAAVPDEGIRACLESFRVSLAEKGLELRTALACPEPRLFDPDLLDQVLGNLLSNAEKYAATGGAVSVSSAPVPDSELILVSVRDWGAGLPPGAAKRLFQPFERFHTKLTDSSGGTGLGLYLVRQLAAAHGGQAWHEEAGPGARFCVTLRAPLVDAAPAGPMDGGPQKEVSPAGEVDARSEPTRDAQCAARHSSTERGKRQSRRPPGGLT
jgi:signal transduction histidine kinase